uniref:Uncharacterized protein n=1 Tax=Acrobeloides nanus TaxID=290746 RepID=A0A914CQJ3_9BILA
MLSRTTTSTPFLYVRSPAKRDYLWVAASGFDLPTSGLWAQHASNKEAGFAGDQTYKNGIMLSVREDE